MAEDKIIIEYEARTKQLDAALAKTEKELRDVEEASKKAFGGVAKEADKAGKPIDNTTKKIKVMSTELNNQQKSVNGLSDTFKTMGANLVAALSVGAVIALGKQIVDATAKNEAFRASLTTMLKDKGRADNLMKQLAVFAATTPFELTEINAATTKLLAFGVQAGDVEKSLRAIGDVSAGIGAPIAEIAELYGKAKVQGRLFGEDINQLTGRGIPIIQELAKQFRVTDGEVKKLVEQGKIGFPQLEKAFVNMTSEGGQFFGLMDAQSKTLGGQISNLSDSYDSLLLAIGQNGSSGVSGAVYFLSSTISEATKAVKGYDSVFTPLMNIFRSSVEPIMRLATSIYDLFAGMANAKDATDGVKLFFTAIEKGVKLAALPLKLTILGITTMIDAVKLLKDAVTGNFSFTNLTKLKEDANQFLKIITLTDGAVVEEKEILAEKEISINKEKEAAITAEQIKAAKERAEALNKLRKILADNKRKQDFEFEQEAFKDVRAQMEESDAALLQSVKDNADDVIDVREEYASKTLYIDDQLYEKQQEKAKKNAEKLKEILKGSFDIAVDLVNGFYDISQQKRQIEFDDQLKKNDEATNSAIASLQQQLDSELITKETFNVKKRELETKQQREEAKIKKKAFESEKRGALVQVAIDTAAAIVKTLANLGYPAGVAAAALAGAAGLAQAAVISAQPVPKFKDGVIDLKGKGTATSDSIPAMLSRGESVMTARETQVHRPILTAIRDNSIDDYIRQSYVLPALRSIDVKNNRDRASRDMNTNRLLGEIAQNSTDTSKIESLLKKNKKVGVDNASEIGKAVAREMQINSTWFK